MKKRKKNNLEIWASFWDYPEVSRLFRKSKKQIFIDTWLRSGDFYFKFNNKTRHYRMSSITKK